MSQVVWSAWLSTLGHAPSVMDLADTANVHHLADTASNLVDKFVPVSFQVCLLLPCMAGKVCVQATLFELRSSNLFFSPLLTIFNANLVMTLGSCGVKKEDSVGAGPQNMFVNLLFLMAQQDGTAVSNAINA